MDIKISEELVKRIQWKVDAGIYSSADEVMERALDLLDQRDVAVAMVQDLVQEGIDDFKAGRYKTYSSENSDELLEDIKQRALELEAERKTKTRRIVANYSLSAAASTDLAHIRNYYRRRGAEQVASRMIARLRDCFILLAEHPFAGVERPFVPGMRSYSVPGTRYIILYFPDRKPVEIHRVLHGSQDIAHLFE